MDISEGGYNCIFDLIFKLKFLSKFGFTSVPWSYETYDYMSSVDRYKTDSTAFLFTLTNSSDTPMKFKVT